MKSRPLAAFLARLIWLSVLPLVLAAAGLAIDSVLTQQEAIRQQAANMAKNFATAIDYFLNARIRALNMLAVSPLADDPQRWPELYTEAQGFRESFGSHVILADTFEPMQMLFNTCSPLDAKLPFLPQHMGHAAAPAALSTGRPAVGDTFVGPVAKETLVALAIPGIRAGKVVHLLLTIMETKRFQQRMEQEALPENWALTLKDGRGDIIAQRAPAGFEARRDVGDEGRFVALSTVSPWSVTVEISRRSLNAPVLSAGIALTLGILAATFVGVLGGTLAGRRLGRQVAALAEPSSSDGPPLDIAEIATARHLLNDAAARLRLSESRFEATFEQAAAGIAMVSLDGHWLRVNDQFCRIVDYSRDELRSRSEIDLTYPDDRETDRDGRTRLLAGETNHFSREKRFLRRDGSVAWINLSVALVRTTDGAPDYFIAVIEDIQARKDAEEALMESEQRYRQLVENANSAILHWSQDGTILFINEFAQQLFGWPAEEIVGRHVGVLVPERESTGADLSELVRNIATHPERYRQNMNENIRRDGSRLWMTWANRAIRGEQGRITGILAVGNDITAQKRIEEELKHRNEELERFDRASVGRELQMIELKRQVNDLSRQLGRTPPFDLSFTEVA